MRYTSCTLCPRTLVAADGAGLIELIASHGLGPPALVRFYGLRARALVLLRALEPRAILFTPRRGGGGVLRRPSAIGVTKAVALFAPARKAVISALTEFLALHVAPVPSCVQLPVAFLAQCIAWSILGVTNRRRDNG